MEINTKKKACFGPVYSAVYHYCSVESLFGILSTHQLYLSHARYLNDHMELKWINNILKKYENQLTLQLDRHLFYQIKKLFSYYKGDAYIACFSANKDVLSQWRAYADDGFGVSLGFNSEKFKRNLCENLKYIHMLYHEEEQINAVRRIVHDCKILSDDGFLNKKVNQNPMLEIKKSDANHAISFLKEHIKLSDILSGKEFSSEKNKKVSACIKALIAFSHCTKNNAFHEEAERRLCYLPDASSNILTDISDLKHRCVDKKIIPHYALQFDGYKDIITEIVLGPRCKLDDYALRSFLKKMGYTKVKITRSLASYR